MRQQTIRVTLANHEREVECNVHPKSCKTRFAFDARAESPDIEASSPLSGRNVIVLLQCPGCQGLLRTVVEGVFP